MMLVLTTFVDRAHHIVGRVNRNELKLVLTQSNNAPVQSETLKTSPTRASTGFTRSHLV